MRGRSPAALALNESSPEPPSARCEINPSYVWTGRGPDIHWQQGVATSKASLRVIQREAKQRRPGIWRG